MKGQIILLQITKRRRQSDVCRFHVGFWYNISHFPRATENRFTFLVNKKWVFFVVGEKWYEDSFLNNTLNEISSILGLIKRFLKDTFWGKLDFLICGEWFFRDFTCIRFLINKTFHNIYSDFELKTGYFTRYSSRNKWRAHGNRQTSEKRQTRWSHPSHHASRSCRGNH